MIYKIILGKNEINIDEEDKNKIIANIDKNFILLKSGEVINPSFVQGIFIDHEATRQNNKLLRMENNTKQIDAPRGEIKDIKSVLNKFRPNFDK